MFIDVNQDEIEFLDDGQDDDDDIDLAFGTGDKVKLNDTSVVSGVGMTEDNKPADNGDGKEVGDYTF